MDKLTDDDLNVILQDWDESDPMHRVAIQMAEELVALRRLAGQGVDEPSEPRYRELLTVKDVERARAEGLRIESQWAGDSWIYDTTRADWPGWSDWLKDHKARALATDPQAGGG